MTSESKTQNLNSCNW